MRQHAGLGLICIMIFGALLRLWNGLHDQSLWLDEVFSAKLAESPLRDLLLAVPRFDTHPPLYYVQLHVWALFGRSDAWLVLNSVLLDCLVILSLLVTVRRLFGTAAGLWTAALYAVLPLAVFFAENLRMYAMFYLLLVWLWYHLERRVRAGGATGWNRIGVIALGLALTLTHGLGFFVAFFVYFQALVRLWAGHGKVAGLRPALLLVLDYVPVALAAAYPLGIGLFRQTEGVAEFSAAVIGIHLTISLFGMEFPAPTIAGYAGALLILLPPLLLRPSRVVAAWLVLLPFAALLVISLTVKSVFMYRSMGLFLPFVAISGGLLLSTPWPRMTQVRQPLAAVMVLLLGVISVHSAIQFRKEGYGAIAAIWAAEAEPDATLFVDAAINLWGFSRYLEDVPRYSALTVQPPVRDGLARLRDRLVGTWFDSAGLFGETDHVTLGARRIWTHPDPAVLAELDHYWVLSPPDGSCLRPGDAVLQTFAATGQTLVHCAAPTAS